MWSVTNYFLVNLTAADLMMSILNCIPSFIFMRDRSVQYQVMIKLLQELDTRLCLTNQTIKT